MTLRRNLAAVLCAALCLVSGACRDDAADTGDDGADAGDVDVDTDSDASGEADIDTDTDDETQTDGGDGDGDMPSPADLVLPRTLALPYVSAGTGGSMGAFQIVNLGELVAEGPNGADLSWSLEGDDRLSLIEAPSRVEPGAEETIVLAFTGAGAVLLSDVFGAAFMADDSNSHAVIGTGTLMNLGSVTFAGPSAPYDEDYPDVLTSGGAGELVLLYDNGDGAAVGIADRAVLVGFPLELIDAEDDRTAVVGALLDFVSL
jgi:hypothetical protein